MAKEIVVKTILELPDGYIPSAEDLAEIQKIIDGDSGEIPVCDAVPTPLNVVVNSKTKIIADWHGINVDPVAWFVKNTSNGSTFDTGQISPKPSDNGKLTINLSKELTSKTYKIVLEGVKCKGSGEPLVFDNPFYDDGSQLEKCSRPPKPTKVTIQSDKVWLIKWDGDGVYKLNSKVVSKSGIEIGSKDFEPKVSDNATLTMPLNIAPTKGETYVITLTGLSCLGSGSIEFMVPNDELDLDIESIELTDK